MPSTRPAATPAALGDKLLQRLRAPPGPRQLSIDTCLQNQILQALSAASEWPTEIAFLDAAVGLEKCAVALEICVRARNIDAKEAVALGLAHSAVPVGDLANEVDVLVRSVLQSDTEAVRETKRLLQSAEDLDPEQQRTLEAAAQVRRLRALAGGQTDSDQPRF